MNKLDEGREAVEWLRSHYYHNPANIADILSHALDVAELTAATEALLKQKPPHMNSYEYRERIGVLADKRDFALAYFQTCETCGGTKRVHRVVDYEALDVAPQDGEPCPDCCKEEDDAKA